jgi:transcriptional antiterminator NusG
MNWYALFVETGKEDLVQTMIRKYFDESAIHAIVPKRKLQERKQGQIIEVCKTMFPGYVLINTRMNSNIYYTLKRIPRYYRLLNKYSHNDQNEEFYENNLFSKIDDSEMDSILQLIDHDGTIDYSTLYLEDGKVFVRKGPLMGLEGVIKKIDKRKKRARIVLNFMGNEICLDLGIEMLVPLENR